MSSLANLLLLVAPLCNIINTQSGLDGSICKTGDARLVGGSTNSAGILEICYNGVWGTVCRDSVDVREATLICRHIGFLPIGAEIEDSVLYDSPAPDSMTLSLDCGEDEDKFSDCTLATAVREQECTDTTALRCLPCLNYRPFPKLFYCPGGTVRERDVVCIYDQKQCDSNIDCIGAEDEYYCDSCRGVEDNGKVRLVDGHSIREGRLEICMNGRWGTVCDNGFDTADAVVVCNQLGFPTPRAKIRSFGPSASNIPIWLDNIQCTGFERSIMECTSQGRHSCGHIQDVGVMCLPEQNCTTGELRLIGGSGPHEGRVEVCHGNQWTTICDDGWDEGDAGVVCRQIGYDPRGAVAYRGAFFGPGFGPITLMGVNCSGEEENLLDCPTQQDLDCTHTQDVAVTCSLGCESDQFECTFGTLSGDGICINSTQICDGVNDCVGGEDEQIPRLVGGIFPFEGRVEYCVSGEWQTVCDDRWNDNDAEVVCRQLGYDVQDADGVCCAAFGRGPESQQIFQQEFQCSGTERNLSECSVVNLGRRCDHREDAGVICRCDINTFPCRETTLENPVCITDIQFCDGIRDCPGGSDEPEGCPKQCSNVGEIRLVSDESTDQNEGRVEICFGGQWGSVCDDSWDYNDAAVVCRQLGFGTIDAVAQIRSFFGQGTGPVFLDEVNCRGVEGALIDCSRARLGRVSSNCRTHSEDASVICPTICPNHQYQCIYGRVDGQQSPCVSSEQRCDGITDCAGGDDELEHNCPCAPEGAVRLLDGIVPYRGRVEYCVNGRWSGLCSSSWSNTDAAVVCRQLGYPSAGATVSCCQLFGTAPEKQPIIRDRFNCRGNERNLSQCSRTLGGGACPVNQQYVGVMCSIPEAQFPCLNSAPDYLSNVTELQFCDGNDDCGDNSDEPSYCPDECLEPGKLRLVINEEVGENEGRVEMCYGGRWGTICDDAWDYFDAQVVCRQLGFGSTGAIAYTGSRYGLGSGPVHLSNVLCSGSETNINDCKNINYGHASSNCRTHFKDASVLCPTLCPDDMFECPHGRVGNKTSSCISSDQRCDGMTDCVGGEDELDNNCPCGPEGAVRLVDTFVPYRGRVEMCQHRRWRSICSRQWNNNNAAVTCRQLGYPTEGARASCCGQSYGSGPDSQPFLRDNFNCGGNERSLSECSISPGTECDHSRDVVVICSIQVDEFPCASTPQNIPSNVTELQYCDGVNDCFDGTDEPQHCPTECLEPGKVRLVNNGLTNVTEGRVEICIGGEWGTVCDDAWDFRDAEVVCRQLGYETRGVRHRGGSEYGPGTGPVHMDDVDCTGSENKLTSCQHRLFGEVSSNCLSHLEDVSVICSSDCPDSMFTCHNGRIDGLQPACVTTQQRCDGIIDCVGAEDEMDYNCPCSPEGSVRLVDFFLPYRGRLEFCVNGRWSTVCSRSSRWSSRAASAVCHQLGYPSEDAEGYRNVRGHELQPISVDNFNCRGDEDKLSQCLTNRDNFFCNHGLDVSVFCRSFQTEFLCSNASSDTPSSISVLQICDGIIDCSDGSDERNCSSPLECLQPGEVRLVQGQRVGGREGRMEICIGGEWSTVCSRSWDYRDAQVVCRQLGFGTTGALSSFGSPSGKVKLSNVACDGSESSLLNCTQDFLGEVRRLSCGTHGSVMCSTICPEGTIECTDGRIDRQQPACISTEQRCDGVSDCIGGEDELDSNCPCGPEGTVRLAGGFVPQQGRVELCKHQRWTTICNRFWDDRDASVVCHQLGYSREGAKAGRRFQFRSLYTSQPIEFDDFNCRGRESSLLECDHTIGNPGSCGPASVICTCSDTSQVDPPCLTELQICDGNVDSPNGTDEANCQTECTTPGEVRLVNGGNTDGPEGRVEICFQGSWGSVCRSTWGRTETQVVCRQLGFESAGDIPARLQYGPGEGPVHLEEIGCTGRENSLLECSHNPVGSVSPTCRTHLFDIAVECLTEECGDNEIMCRDGRVDAQKPPCIATEKRCDGVIDCFGGEDEYCADACSPDGVVRLVGGRLQHEGRVEICLHGQWARVCGTGIRDSNDATVICRQLGYPTENAIAQCCSSRFGSGYSVQTIVTDSFHCTGNEPNISQCVSTSGSTCQSADAVVVCNCPESGKIPCSIQNEVETTCVSELQICDGIRDCPDGNDENNCATDCSTPGEIRLVDGYGVTNGSDGRVEICFKGQWGTVCDNAWDYWDAEVVCRQLGYGTNGAMAFSRSQYGLGSGPVHLDNLNCAGSEDSLVNCTRQTFSDIGANCNTHQEDASIICNTVCPEGTFECKTDSEHTVCISSDQRCDGVRDCIGGEDEQESNCPCGPEGKVRLVDGIVPYQGRVEICRNSIWTSICSSNWNNNDATVVCRQLGYHSGGVASCCGINFPRVSIEDEQPVLRDRFNCRGSEEVLTDCSRTVGSECDHSRDVSVICTTTDNEFPCLEASVSNETVNDFQFCDGTLDCIDGSDEPANCPTECQVPGEVRLIDGNRIGELEGTVEICFGGKWSTVCSTSWDYRDAEVVCRQLGFGTGGALASITSDSIIDPVAAPPVLDRVECSRSEKMLTDCSYDNIGVVSSNCRRNANFAAVTCPTICPENTTECKYGRVDGREPPCVPTEQHCDGVADCIGGEDELDYNCPCAPEGAARLVNGTVPHLGRVEFCTNGRWSALCDYRWSDRDSRVLCRQLGYPNAERRLNSRDLFGNRPNNQPKDYDELDCSGNEDHLSECDRNVGFQRCNEDLGLICSCPEREMSPCVVPFSDEPYCINEFQFCDGHADCPNGTDELMDCGDECSIPGEIRLVNGERPNEGRIEICMRGQWGTICDDSWSDADTEVVCRQLGFGTAGAMFFPWSHYGPGVGPVHLNDVQCTGMESNFTECRYQFARSNNVFRCRDHFADVSVLCPTVCPDDKFMCTDGRIDGQQPACISTEQRCDGVTDCIGGEDELDSNCPCGSEGTVRLVDGIFPHSGRVEICHNARWSTICSANRNFGRNFETVLCRQLGFPSEDAITVPCCERYGAGLALQPIYSGEYFCNGREDDLSQCRMFGRGRTCKHDRDISVVCGCPMENQIPCRQDFDGNMTCISELQYCDGRPDCADGLDEPLTCSNECSTPGALQLVNGRITDGHEGRVEVCYKGQWGTICQDSWNYYEAEVACRQLGLGTIFADSYTGARYGRGQGPVYLSNLACSGSEARLTDCDRDPFGQVSSNCRDHSRDVSISCGKCPDSMFECKTGRVDGQNPRCISTQQRCDNITDCLGSQDELENSCPCEPEGAVRLVGGSGLREGRVEFCRKSVWATVCNRFDQWRRNRNSVPAVVCRELGFSSQGAQAPSCCDNFGSGPSTQPVDRAIFYCTGRENTLSDCRQSPDYTCEHNFDASVICRR